MIMTTSGHNSDAVSEKSANTCLLFAVEPTVISTLHQSQTVDTHVRHVKPHDEKADSHWSPIKEPHQGGLQLRSKMKGKAILCKNSEVTTL